MKGVGGASLGEHLSTCHTRLTGAIKPGLARCCFEGVTERNHILLSMLSSDRVPGMRETLTSKFCLYAGSKKCFKEGNLHLKVFHISFHPFIIVTLN